MLRTVAVSPYDNHGLYTTSSYYEHSENSKRRRCSPLSICLCLLCAFFLIGAIVAGILLGILLKSDTATTTTIESTRIFSTKITSTTSTTLTSTTTDVPCVPACNSEQTCVKGTCVGIGFLSFTLTWSRPGDGDIVVKTPEDKIIYFSNANVSVNTSGGQLDVDNKNETGPENIFWSSSGSIPPAGTYYVCFSQYHFVVNASSTDPITATIKIEKPPNPTQTFSRTFTSWIKDYNQCDSTSDHFLASIDYP